MEDAPKKRGRPPKVKAARVVTPPNQGEQINLQELLHKFIVACNQQNEARAEGYRDALVYQMDKLAGLR